MTGAAALVLAVALQPPIGGPTCDARQAAVGDLDHDGRDEFALACSGGPDLVVRLTSAGTLDTVWSSAESGDSRCVTWGDYDDDGDLDLAVAGMADVARIYRNDDGVLHPHWSAPEPTASRDCEFADIDGDSDVDLLVVGSGPDQIYINERGAFGPPRSLYLGGETDDVALFDFDRDGDLDLLAAISDPASPDLLFRNEGGSFLRHWAIPAKRKGVAVAWADYDRDGRPDFAIARPGDADEIWRQTENGGFEQAFWNNPPSHSFGVLWADLDADGRKDLLITGDGPLALWGNGPTEWLPLERPPGPAVAAGAVAVGDADNNGYLDVLLGTRDGAAKTEPTLRLYLGGTAPEDVVEERPDDSETLLTPDLPERPAEAPPSLMRRLLRLLWRTALLAAILFGGWRVSKYIKRLDHRS